MQDNSTPPLPNPSGFCQCGCGQITPIAPRTRNERGVIKGEHVRYVLGHAPKQERGPRLHLVCNYCEIAYERRPSDKPSRFCSAECREASKKRVPVLVDALLAHVPLTRGQIAIIDATDMDRVGIYTWDASPNEHGGFYAKCCIDGDYVYLHRFIMDFPSSLTDHISGDTLDDRRGNLRVATHVQNMQNRRARRSRSLPKGVYQTKNGVYEAKIQSGEAMYYLGVHSTPEEAARAYDLKARELFGEFARLNFLDNHDSAA